MEIHLYYSRNHIEQPEDNGQPTGRPHNPRYVWNNRFSSVSICVPKIQGCTRKGREIVAIMRDGLKEEKQRRSSIV